MNITKLDIKRIYRYLEKNVKKLTFLLMHRVVLRNIILIINFTSLIIRIAAIGNCRFYALLTGSIFAVTLSEPTERFFSPLNLHIQRRISNGT